MKKLLYIVLGLLAIAVVLVFTGNKSVHHEHTIKAPVGVVWKTLTEMEKYPDWNPVMELVEGEVQEGAQVKYRYTQEANKSYVIEATVVKIVPEQLLNQKGGIPLVLTFNHRYVLEPNDEGTQVTIHEDYRGIGVNFWNPQPVEAAYQRLNEALKTRAEQASI